MGSIPITSIPLKTSKDYSNMIWLHNPSRFLYIRQANYACSKQEGYDNPKKIARWLSKNRYKLIGFEIPKFDNAGFSFTPKLLYITKWDYDGTEPDCYKNGDFFPCEAVRIMENISPTNKFKLRLIKRSPIPPKLRFYILQKYSFRCCYCGRTSEETEIQVDHVVPDKKGGKSEETNLITACWECNNGKGSQTLQNIPTTLNRTIQKKEEKTHEGYSKTTAKS